MSVAMPFVTDTHRRQLAEIGVTRIESVIPQDHTDAVLRALPAISSVDLDNPASWHSLPAEATTDFSAETAVPVAGRAGDLIIWNSKLPHGPGPNRSELPRSMQAVTMFPAEESPLRNATPLSWSRLDQIEWWQTKRAPPWWRGVPNQQDPEPGEPAILTSLGRRLVGIDRWPE